MLKCFLTVVIADINYNMRHLPINRITKHIQITQTLQSIFHLEQRTISIFTNTCEQNFRLNMQINGYSAVAQIPSILFTQNRTTTRC